MSIIALAVLWIFCGIGAAIVASNRGANGCLWFGFGVFLGPFGLAFAFVSGSNRECPSCRKRVHPQATKCPYCQSELVPLVKKENIWSREDSLVQYKPGKTDNISIGLAVWVLLVAVAFALWHYFTR